MISRGLDTPIESIILSAPYTNKPPEIKKNEWVLRQFYRYGLFDRENENKERDRLEDERKAE